jgi:hypothetical protein
MRIKEHQFSKIRTTTEIIVSPEEAAQIIEGLAAGINQTRFHKYSQPITGLARSWAQPRIRVDEFQEYVFKVEDKEE